MAVTKKPWGYILAAAADTVSLNTQMYVKFVAFETAAASADGTFSLVDASSGGVSIVPDYDYVDASLTAPAQFIVENFVGQVIYLASLPTGGRVFVYTGRRP